MGKKRLRSLLTELHSELEVADAVSPEDQGLLAEVMADIEGVLEDETASSGETSLENRLGQGVVRFENRHPRLSFTLERIIDTLTAMGI